MSRFDDLLAEAMREYERTGYTSFERLQQWEAQLREALRRELRSESEINQRVRQGYDKLFGRALRGMDSEIERYTVSRIHPSLRDELNRRIKASADLIVLQRDETIDRTLRRFDGFVTAQPVGGGVIDKREVKEELKREYKQFDYRERRCFNDQGHKMVANLNALVAEQGGAIAARWRSNYKASGYQYRPEHKALDGKIYAIRDNWAIKNGLMKVGSNGYHDTIVQPAVEVNCTCSWVYIYTVDKLPPDMLTKKGEQAAAELKGKTEMIKQALLKNRSG